MNIFEIELLDSTAQLVREAHENSLASRHDGGDETSPIDILKHSMNPCNNNLALKRPLLFTAETYLSSNTLVPCGTIASFAYLGAWYSIAHPRVRHSVLKRTR